mgnify:CR=1 FL=1
MVLLITQGFAKKSKKKKFVAEAVEGVEPRRYAREANHDEIGKAYIKIEEAPFKGK